MAQRIPIITVMLLSASLLKGQAGALNDLDSLLMNFAYRYAKEVSALKTPQLQAQRMKDDKVLFLVGKPEHILHLPDTCTLDITYGDGYYEMSWKQDSLPILHMAFPAQNTLITGRSQREMTDSLPRELQSMQTNFVSLPAPSELVPMGSTSLWMTTSSSYYMQSLTDALYYRKSDKGASVPVFDDEHRALSATNLLHGLINRNYRMRIALSLYDFSLKPFMVSLCQWLSYCRKHRLHIYCGIEEEREDGLKLLVIAENRELRYNHMLSVIVPDYFVRNENAILRATLNAFIPTHNVQELFKQYQDKKEKKHKL